MIAVKENQEVQGFKVRDNNIVGVETAEGLIQAEQVIIAAGAWSGELLAMLDKALPVEPVHGQMMLFKAKLGLVNRVILKGGRYVIPRNDGRVLVGSTMERIGFTKQTTQEAAESLHATALDIIPALADYEVEHHWSGLRPGSPEGIPFIGQVTGFDNLYINAGQFRNGLVLAPASTRLLADILLQRDRIIPAEPYAMNR